MWWQKGLFPYSLSDSFLLVYRNARDFCLLILYPATLLTSLMSSTSFLIAFVGFSIYIIMSYTKSFTSFFPIWFPFISFCSLIAMARTSKTMLNKSGKSGHPCPVSHLRGKAFSFSLLSILAVGLSCMAFIILMYVPSMLTFWRGIFNHK